MTAVPIDVFRGIARQHLNTISHARGDSVNSFVETVLMWLAQWAAEKQYRADIPPGYCAIVLDADAAMNEQLPGFDYQEFFKEDHTPLLGGKVFLADYALNRVHRHDANCRDLGNVTKALRAVGYADRPFIAFDVETLTVFIHEQGAQSRPSTFPIRPKIQEPFNTAVFQGILDDIYNQSLRYPQPYPGLWYDTMKRIPVRNTELIVQSHLGTILRARALGHGTSGGAWLTIRERENNAGRADIAVYQQEKCIVISEIKVLRERRFRRDQDAAKAQKVSPKVNERWARRGAWQAERYKNAEPAQSAVLVLYDMRETDADIESAKKECEKRSVKHLRYYLYNEIPDLS